MNWTLCIICQQQTAEALKCPLKAKARDKSEAYASFLKNVNKFNQLPIKLNFDLDKDVDKLVKQEAKWHKSCHMKFNMSKLQRARKRGLDEATGNSS